MRIFLFTEMNAAFCGLIECDEKVLNHLKLAQIIPDKKIVQQITNELKEKGFVESIETDIKYKNAEIKQCILSASKEIDLDGKYYYQGILHDITFIRKAERATLQAEKLAAAGRLVRTLAHEVRNPINNINLAVEQLNSFEKQEEEQLYLDIIYRNSNRINELIKELLNSSKPEQIQMSAAHVNIIIDEMIAAALDRIKLKNIELLVEYPEEKIMLSCDCPKLVLALLNIFGKCHRSY